MVLYKYCTTALCNTVLLTLQPKIWKPWNGRLVFYDWCPAINGTCRWNVGLFWAKQLPLRIYSKQTSKQTNKQTNKDQKVFSSKLFSTRIKTDESASLWVIHDWWPLMMEPIHGGWFSDDMHLQCDVFYISLWQCSFIASRRQCDNAMRQCNYNLCNAWWWWSAHDSEPQRIQNTGFHFSVSFEHWSGNSLIKGFVFSQVTLQGKGDWGEKQTALSCFFKVIIVSITIIIIIIVIIRWHWIDSHAFTAWENFMSLGTKFCLSQMFLGSILSAVTFSWF